MTTQLQNAIIAASTIGSLLSNYKPSETNKNIKQIRADVKKIMFKRSKTNPKEFREAVMIADKAWRDTINHFCEIEEKMEIEALFSVMNVFNLYEEPLTRFANISQKKMEKVMFMVADRVEYKHEKNSATAMNYYLDKLSESTGVKRVSKLKTRRKILERKLIAENRITML